MSSGQVPARRRRAGRTGHPRGLLIAAEGLDGSGKSATLEGIARWLERRGRPVVTIAWRPSELVARAVLNPRSRPALTPRVAALLAAADAQARIGARIERRLAAGTTVLADRYAWTAIAREVARGLEPDWSANLHAVLPAPDLVVYHRSNPGSAVEQALAGRPASVRSAAVGAAYGEFVGRLLLAYEQPRGRRRPAVRRRPIATVADALAGPGRRSRPRGQRPPGRRGAGRAGRVWSPRPGGLMAPIASPVARLGAHGEPGVLVVLEGTDRAGRSTHTRLLEQHLRYAGRPVIRTSLASSALAAGPIRASRPRPARSLKSQKLRIVHLSDFYFDGSPELDGTAISTGPTPGSFPTGTTKPWWPAPARSSTTAGATRASTRSGSRMANWRSTADRSRPVSRPCSFGPSVRDDPEQAGPTPRVPANEET